MMNTYALFFRLCALSALLGVYACGSSCSSIAITSVTVTVADESGAPITGADVRYEWDGVEAACEENFGTYACGHENEGDTIVRVNLDGYAPYEMVVRVAADECHVETQRLDVVLTAS